MDEQKVIEEKPEEEVASEVIENAEAVEAVDANEDDFLDEHPIEPEVEEVKEEPKEEPKPVVEEKKPEAPKRPKLQKYEYEDPRLEDIEKARIIWNKGYRKMSLIKMVVSLSILAVILAGWVIPTVTIQNAGATPLYIALGIAAVGILGIFLFGVFQKKKDKAGIATYFTAYYNSLNAYAFDGLGIDLDKIEGNFESKVSEEEVDACGLYPGFAQVGSRENILFTYKNMDCALADMAIQKNESRGLQTVFVGKYLRTHNTVDFPTDGRLIIYFKGNDRAIPPLGIANMEPLEETSKFAVYGPAPLKKILTRRLRTELNKIETDALLVDVAISIMPGRTYWALGYEDDLMVMPNKDPFDPYYVMEYKKQIRLILDIALTMNESSEN